MLRFSNIKLGIDEQPQALQNFVRGLLGGLKWQSFRLVKKALDARSRSQAYFIYTVDVEVLEEADILPQIKWDYVEVLTPKPSLRVGS